MWHAVLLAVIFPSIIATFSCPNGTFQLGNEHRCIFIETSAQYFIWASSQCSVLGGNLAKITSSFESALIFGYANNILNGVSPFIGVEKYENGTWEYSDGTPPTYSNWAPGEPNTNNGYLCAIMDAETTKWRAVDCVNPRPYICTIEAERVMQCPKQWVYSNVLDYCYYLQNFTYVDGVTWQVYNWTSAEKNCFLMDGHLVSIHTKAEDDFVSALVKQDLTKLPHGAPPEKRCLYSNAWIGLYADGRVGSGPWSDGTPVNYTNTVSTASYDAPWMKLNPACDNQSPNMGGWKYYGLETNSARFVCKQPSKSRAIREQLSRVFMSKNLYSRNLN